MENKKEKAGKNHSYVSGLGNSLDWRVWIKGKIYNNNKFGGSIKIVSPLFNKLCL